MLNYTIDDLFGNQNTGSFNPVKFGAVPSFNNTHEGGMGTGGELDQLKNLSLVSRILKVKPGDNIQSALDTLGENGVGGRIELLAGTHYVNYNPTFPVKTPIQIIGDNMYSTIIDFGSANFRFILAGSGIYTTGTVSISSGTTVTGSSTSWLSSGLVAGDQIFLDSRWYKIVSIAGDTTIIISEGYAGSALSGATYRAGSLVQDIELSELTIQNSTSINSAFDVDDVRNILLEDVTFALNNKGYVVTNFSEWNAERIIIPSSTSDGATYNIGSLCINRQVNSIGNGGSGIIATSIKTGTFEICSANGNTTDGFNLTSCTDIYMIPQANSNGGQGIELVSGNDHIVIPVCLASGNMSDGIKLTATSDNCIIGSGGKITGNGGYGVNIAVSTCDNNIITGNDFASNSNGAANDLGTGTVIRGNVGLTDNATSNLVKFGGDGSDGALSVTSGTTTIDLGSSEFVVKNYTSISITGTGALAFSNPHANGSTIVLRSQGAVTITSSATRAIDLRNLGAAGGAGGTGGGGADGSNGNDSNNIIDTSVHGGGGGTTGGGGGGAQIIQGGLLYSNSSNRVTISRTIFIVPGAGGGGGEAGQNDGGGTGGDGGAGGRGAGAMYIECAGSYNVTGTIDLSGTAGSSGTSTNADGGSGGGGAGGMFLALYNTLTADSGTYTVTGGAGGALGAGGAGSAGNGGGGGGTTEAAGTSATPASGGTGAAGGAGANGIAVRMLNIF